MHLNSCAFSCHVHYGICFYVFRPLGGVLRRRNGVSTGTRCSRFQMEQHAIWNGDDCPSLVLWFHTGGSCDRCHVRSRSEIGRCSLVLTVPHQRTWSTGHSHWRYMMFHIFTGQFDCAGRCHYLERFQRLKFIPHESLLQFFEMTEFDSKVGMECQNMSGPDSRPNMAHKLWEGNAPLCTQPQKIHKSSINPWINLILLNKQSAQTATSISKQIHCWSNIYYHNHGSRSHRQRLSCKRKGGYCTPSTNMPTKLTTSGPRRAQEAGRKRPQEWIQSDQISSLRADECCRWWGTTICCCRGVWESRSLWPSCWYRYIQSSRSKDWSRRTVCKTIGYQIRE